jgi:phosphatidylserine/phosphatidylglycerophosphate/cardiolipin synthase-like enzyme
MRRVAIFLRNAGPVNKFRRAILNTLRTDVVDEALMCSGFFQDDKKYSAGADLDLISHRTCAPLKLTTLGLYSYSWKAQYETFFTQLKASNQCHCFSAVQKRISGMGWHAKIFLAKGAGRPLVGVIGSSNITRRAFGELADFNYECDVVLWDESVAQVNAAIETAIDASDDLSDVIVTNYDPDFRTNRSPLPDRLLTLESQVLARAINV